MKSDSLAIELTQAATIDAAQATMAAQAVHALEERWTRRHPMAPVFTLGAASSYPDAVQAHGQIHYRQLAKRQNPLLREHFGWLHQRIHDALESVLDEPVTEAVDCGLPGFIIFLPSPLFTIRSGTLHEDLQFKRLDWSHYTDVDLDRTLSFTLPVELPNCGAGLRMWPSEPGTGEGGLDQPTSGNCTIIPYGVGHMVVHDGRTLHQVAPPKSPWTDGARITCQGHALFCDGAWRTYW